MFMLRSLIGGLLGERAQIATAKEICLVIVKQMNALGMLTRRYWCHFISCLILELKMAPQWLQTLFSLSLSFPVLWTGHRPILSRKLHRRLGSL